MDHIQELFGIIKKKLVHPYRQRTIDKATLYRQLITGEDIEVLVRKYIPMEEENVVRKILQITNPILKPLTSRLISINRKIPRSNSVVITLAYKGQDSQDKVRLLEDNYLSKYWGDKSVDEYFATRYIELIDIDPNAWIVTEWDATTGEEISVPYPVEYRSSEVLTWKYYHNILQYLVVCAGKKHILYGIGETVVFTEQPKESTIKVEKDKIIELPTGTYANINDVIYLVKTFNTGLEYVPAFRVGTFRDEYTDGETYVNIFDKAVPYILGSIKTCIERDLMMSMSAFAQRWQYERACPNKMCNGGVLNDGGSECPTCKGSGTSDIKYTAFHTITFPLPKDKESFFPLDQMVKFHYPESAILELVNNYVEEIYWKCVDVIYNAESRSRQEIAQAVTATEKIFTNQSKYDVIYPVALNEAANWTFTVKLIAQVTGKSNGLVAVKTYKRDFNLNSRDELVEEYKAQVAAGLPEEILRKTVNEIAKMDSSDSPEKYQAFQVRQRFAPFSGKKTEEIAQIMAGNLCRKRDKILYTNWNLIWQELEIENYKAASEGDPVSFYDLSIAKISERLEAKIQEFADAIEEDTQRTPSFRETNLPTNEE